MKNNIFVLNKTFSVGCKFNLISNKVGSLSSPTLQMKYVWPKKEKKNKCTYFSHVWWLLLWLENVNAHFKGFMRKIWAIL